MRRKHIPHIALGRSPPHDLPCGLCVVLILVCTGLAVILALTHSLTHVTIHSVTNIDSSMAPTLEELVVGLRCRLRSLRITGA